MLCGLFSSCDAAAAAKSLQSCPTLCDPHRRQPTRLPRPWDSPGKNTGVGCHFLLQCMRVKSESESEVVSDSSRPHGLQPTRLLRPWDFPGKSTGVGCPCLLRSLWWAGTFLSFWCLGFSLWWLLWLQSRALGVHWLQMLQHASSVVAVLGL